MKTLVYIDEYDLLGSNYYYKHAQRLGINQKELSTVGVVDARVLVHRSIIKPLRSVDEALRKRGFRIYIKDGYRSREMYQLAFAKRARKYGKTSTEKLMNMEAMLHTTGKAVDVALWDNKKNREVSMRDKRHKLPAMLLDFYKRKSDTRSKRFHGLQVVMIEIMQKHGFRLGPKGEFFHFMHSPTSPKNYQR